MRVPWLNAFSGNAEHLIICQVQNLDRKCTRMFISSPDRPFDTFCVCICQLDWMQLIFLSLHKLAALFEVKFIGECPEFEILFSHNYYLLSICQSRLICQRWQLTINIKTLINKYDWRLDTCSWLVIDHYCN